MIPRLLFLSFLLLLLFCTAAAQVDPPKKVDIVSGGIVNGKATKLVRPAYPAAARAARAEGAVNVMVLIDEQGVVISAEAVSGHPLLRAASVKAAQASTFLPTLLQGIPVKVRGVIVYNFVGDEPPAEIRLGRSYFRLGADLLGHGFAGQISPDDVLKQLPADWIKEREEIARIKPAPTPTSENNQETVRTGESQTARYDVGTLKAPPLTRGDNFWFDIAESRLELTPETMRIRNGVVGSVEQRLAGDATFLWWFKAGRVYADAVAVADSKNAAQRRAAADAVMAVADSAPRGIPDLMLRKLRTNAERINAGVKAPNELGVLRTTISSIITP